MERTVVIEKENLDKLEQFKGLFEAVVEQEFEFDDYVNIIISVGIDNMVRDTVPEEQEWNTIRAAFHKDFGFMCDLLADIWKKGAQEGEEEKKDVKERMDRYIK